MKRTDEPRDLMDIVDDMQRGVILNNPKRTSDEALDLVKAQKNGNWSSFESERRAGLRDESDSTGSKDS